MRYRIGIVGLLVGLAPAASAQIVDHAALAGVPALPQAVMDAIGQQRWLFTHASVGGNMVDGLDDLHAANPTRYRLATAWVGFDDLGLRADPPPAPTAPGTVYECQRGNPGWAEKLAIFDNSVRLAGWRRPAVDIVMDKLCYIDQDASAAASTAALDALAAAYPQTVVVFTTMPLTTDGDADNVLRNQYNQAVRAHVAASGGLLFDLADMEAFTAAGAACTFVLASTTYQRLCAAYTDDGGHLNTVGRQRIATGWYAVAAVIALRPVFTDAFETGDLNGWSHSQP